MTPPSIADRRARDAGVAVRDLDRSSPSAASPAPSAPPPGPPFPAPEVDRAVYDYAGILSPEAIAARGGDDRQRSRHGPAPRSSSTPRTAATFPSTDETEAKARALMDQWGVGRKGFNDGLVIFFDMQPNLEHGQVQLYAGPGFEAAFLSNEERQSIFQNDMLPSLAAGDFDGALAAALEKVDAAATPEHADALQRSRQINAVVGLVGGSVVFLGLTGWALFSWRRYGKDPVYLDDPSVLMPAPPPDLTAASGAMIMDGATSRRALTTAMLDLASRGYIAFRRPAGRAVRGPQGRDRCRAGRRRCRHGGPTPAQPAPSDRSRRRQVALDPAAGAGRRRRRRSSARTTCPSSGRMSPNSTPRSRIMSSIGAGSGNARARSSRAGPAGASLAIVGGVIALVAGLNIPLSGLTLLGGAAIAAGIVVVIIARSMPAVTITGSMIRAMLAAYRRTLQKTMAQARSMQQVVDEAGLGLARYPRSGRRLGDRAGAPGRDRGRPVAQPRGRQGGPDQRRRALLPGLVPDLERDAVHELGRGGGSGASLFSDSGIPDVGGMMSALGTIGNSPASSGGGGGGGFGGGCVGRWRRRRRRRVLAAARAGRQAPNMSRQASRPSIASGGRGRARHCSSVIRKFCVVRATPSGARLP